ncbi:tyrosine--tRNA ligase [Candidatus Dojkabacteria bacterium]|nr:tyrosine--tRNA ligase [Candidatus Dojkabacteria bacterium]
MFNLSKQILQKFPKASVGCLVVRNIDNTKALDNTYQILWNQIEQSAREKNSKKENSEWVLAFQKVGLNPDNETPSHIALLKRVRERQEIPSINPLVNIYNAVSLKYLVPLGGHDLDKISGNITVGPNLNELKFIEMNSNNEIKVPEDEIVYADEKHILTRKWVWRQSNTSKTTEETKNIFIPIDNTGNKSDKEIKKIAIEIKSLISKFLGTKNPQFTFSIADSTKPSLDLDNLPELKRTASIKVKTYPIKKDSQIIKEITTRAVETIVPSAEMLEKMLNSGRRLNVYQGFDPTAPTLHIGHTAGMRKLKYFQQLGHRVIFLIGDFTARIGDPTDKSAARQKLTKEQVKKNLKLYQKQASRILDFKNKKNPVEIMYNSQWLDKMNFQDVIELASEFTVQQMIKRDMFQKRINEDRPIFIHEFMYPLMQGYDSVRMNIDVEVGGNDQVFNMICGRDLVLKHLNKEKVVLPNKLLTDSSGKKMSKTGGNMITLDDSPEDMYGKVMAFTDELICPAFEILTDVPIEKIEKMKTDMKNDKVNPMDLKKQLALEITTEHKGEAVAKKAQEYFEKVFQKQGETTSSDIPVTTVDQKKCSIIDLLTIHTHFTDSNSQAKRLIEQGAVTVDDKKISDKIAIISIPKDGLILRAGKKITKIQSIKQ